MATLRTSLLALVLAVSAVTGGGLSDIKHVVMIMFENRSFDHYYGTMAGVRGFSDPNVQVNPSTNKSTFQQIVTLSMSTLTEELLPWYAGYLGGNWTDPAKGQGSQCTYGGSNAWTEGHESYNNGLNDQWAVANGPWSMQYFKRSDIPVHWSIAEGFTIADMYQQSVIAATNPNRVTWMSGSINVPGGPQTPDQGGTLLQNSCSPGCDQTNPNIGCCPLTWKTVAEYTQDAGVDWEVFQTDFDTAPQILFDIFENFVAAGPGNPLYDRGINLTPEKSLESFMARAENGTLPEVSWLIPYEACGEHPPWLPRNGAWLQREIFNSIINGPSWNDTVLLISYDEEGGWADHVTPYHSPNGTAGEWMEDPYGISGYTFSGPGARVPLTVVSPWTRGGNVFTEHADHNSQILFLEEWLQARGYDFYDEQIPAWRREHMSDLVNMFDFENPDFSVPILATVANPTRASDGTFLDVGNCQAAFPTRVAVPYGLQQPYTELHKVSENGFKAMRGNLTEGRYLTFEARGFALSNPSASTNQFLATKATPDHSDLTQRWVAHQLDVANNGDQWYISSAVDGKFISQHTSLSTALQGAETYIIQFLGVGKGYTLQKKNGAYLGIDATGTVVIDHDNPTTYDLFAVTYNN